MSKVIIVLSILASVAIVTSAAPAGTTDKAAAAGKPFNFSNMVCDACVAFVSEVQENMDQLRPQLDQLCSYCGSPEANRKCLDKLHELENQVEQEKPKDVCVQVGLCRPHRHDAQNFYDFAGQF